MGAAAQHIDRAFESTPRPGPRRFCTEPVDYETSEIALEMRDITWSQMHPFLLARMYEAPFFLSDHGFRYFAPAYMKFYLNVWAGLQWDADLELWCDTDMMFHFSYGFWKHQEGEPETQIETAERKALRIQRFYQRMAGFNRLERECIVAFMQFRIDFDSENDMVNPIECEALDRYWLPSIA